MFIAYHPEDLTVVLAFRSKESALEELPLYFDDNEDFTIVEITNEFDTSCPNEPYIYILLDDHAYDGEQLATYSHHTLSYMLDDLDTREFVGLNQDGSFQTFNGQDIDWSE
jgi:hypothetical protein